MLQKTAIFQDELFLAHDPGHSHPESPERLRAVYQGLQPLKNSRELLFPPPIPAAARNLERVHTSEYVESVARTSGQAAESLDPDTWTSARSYEAALLAAGAAVQGTDMIAAGEIKNAFCLVRPPGHHAENNRAMGFCLFNNIAIAAAHAVEELGMSRVLLVDWDLHHGNGTQQAFYDSGRVLYFSIHQFPYYPGSGAVQETGRNDGAGYTVNIPFPGGQNDRSYAAVFNEILAPLARQYQPEMIMVSAGYDTYFADPLGGMAVSENGFGYMTRVLGRLAEELCNGRLLVSLEGGYNLEGLTGGVLATVEQLRRAGGINSGANGFADLARAGFGPGEFPDGVYLELLRETHGDTWNF